MQSLSSSTTSLYQCYRMRWELLNFGILALFLELLSLLDYDFAKADFPLVRFAPQSPTRHRAR